MRKPLPFVLALSLCSAGFAPSVFAEEGITPTTIKIGTMVALTGPLSPLFSTGQRRADRVDEVNAAGGIHGRKIEYIREDDECLPARGVGAIKKLIYEVKPFIVVGGRCSNAAIAEDPEIIAAGSRIVRHRRPTGLPIW